MASEHNKKIRTQIEALEKQKIGMSFGSFDYPRITADIQALATQLEIEPSEKHWYEKPVGLIVISFISGLLVAYVTFYFGLTK